MAAEQLKIVKNGLWGNNVALVQLLGLCPLLAVSGTFINGLGLGLATMLTLVASNASVSIIRHWVRPEVRIPIFVLIIASIVTTIELAMNAWFHELYKVLGIFIPLIVVNCIILGRAEAYAMEHGPGKSFLDGLGHGLGYSLILIVVATVRELIGSGSLLDHQIFPLAKEGGWYEPNGLLLLAPGAGKFTCFSTRLNTCDIASDSAADI